MASPLPIIALAAGAFFLLRNKGEAGEGKEPIVIKPKPSEADAPADTGDEEKPGDPTQPSGSDEAQGASGQTGEARWAVYYTQDVQGWPPQPIEGWAWRAWFGTPRYSDSNWSSAGMESTKAAALAAAEQAMAGLVGLNLALINKVEEDLSSIVAGNYAQQNFGMPLTLVTQVRDQEDSGRQFTTGMDIYSDSVTDSSGQLLGMVKWTDKNRPKGLSTWWTRSNSSSQTPNEEARVQQLIEALQRYVDPYK